MFMAFQYRNRGTRGLKASSVSMVNLHTSDPKMSIWNDEKWLYQSCVSKLSPTVLLIRIIRNIALTNTASGSIIRAQKPYLNILVILYMYWCMPFFFGLLCLIIWMNTSIEGSPIMKLPLGIPPTPSTLCTKNYGTLFTTMITKRSFLSPCSYLATGLYLHIIVDMILLTGY